MNHVHIPLSYSLLARVLLIYISEKLASGMDVAAVALGFYYSIFCDVFECWRVACTLCCGFAESARGGLAEIVAPEGQREDSAEAKRYRNCHCVQVSETFHR